jgi:hypothetical protein
MIVRPPKVIDVRGRIVPDHQFISRIRYMDLIDGLTLDVPRRQCRRPEKLREFRLSAL